MEVCALLNVSLYANAGSSAFVGLATILIMLPIPGYVGKWVQTVQRELSKRADSRIQSVSECRFLPNLLSSSCSFKHAAMNLVRMIKLFAWQRKIGEEVDARREIELSVLWRRRLLDMVLTIMKCGLDLICPQILTTLQPRYTSYHYDCDFCYLCRGSC
jgi:aryl carrier-like protein